MTNIEKAKVLLIGGTCKTCWYCVYPGLPSGTLYRCYGYEGKNDSVLKKTELDNFCINYKRNENLVR
jgi:hypothetical protein